MTICRSLSCIMCALLLQWTASYSAFADTVVSTGPVVTSPSPETDWLIGPVEARARIEKHRKTGELKLTNGLVSRTLRLAPNGATVGYRNEMTNAAVLRGVKPEAVLTLDGQRIEIGGLKGQPDYAYLDPAWLDAMTSAPEAFTLAGYEESVPEAPYPWQPKRHSPTAPWPPKAVRVTMHYGPSDRWKTAYDGLRVSIVYELYDGLPVLAKWVVVENGTTHDVSIDGLESELLAVTESEKDRVHVESEYAFNTMNTTFWGPDADYLTQVDYEYRMPLLMTSKYPLGPGVRLAPGERFESFRTFELLHDSDDRERRGLARRRMMRLLAPQVTENPILMHVRESDSESVRLAIDQCADAGFEMVIMTFWSGFDIESEDPAYIARIKADADYAHSKGVELGGYTLMTASRDISPEFNVIARDTGKPGSLFGQSVCLASAWSDGYFERVLHFMDATGLDVIETDGPFHGDTCASATHAYHRGYEDSQLRQWQRCAWFYEECRKRGIYINTPDLYYFAGSNKCAMGYRETNFSLPRWRQILIARQNIYDGTFDKTPSMGWMFVPLVEYHGGGPEATMEPLSDHLQEYEWHLAQNFGSGVQACYRGPRIYATDATRAVVKKWVDFYKAHRAILDSDIIHVRRADGAGLDCMLHVNAMLPERALAMVFNPTDEKIEETITLPLYYTGLTSTATISEQDAKGKEFALDRGYRAEVNVNVPAKGITWLAVR